MLDAEDVGSLLESLSQLLQGYALVQELLHKQEVNQFQKRRVGTISNSLAPYNRRLPDDLAISAWGSGRILVSLQPPPNSGGGYINQSGSLGRWIDRAIQQGKRIVRILIPEVCKVSSHSRTLLSAEKIANYGFSISLIVR
jgi:hypothetical protein